MVVFLVRRLAAVIPILVVVALAAFSLRLLLPGDPAEAIAGEFATPERVELIRQRLHLDEPFFIAFATWLLGVLHGDLGTSAISGRTIAEEMRPRVEVTFCLALLATLAAAVLGTLIALVQATFRGSVIDKAFIAFTSVGQAVPSFWLGTMLIVLFSIQLRVFPTLGYVSFTRSWGDWLSHLILPASCLALAIGVDLARLLRATLLAETEKDYVRTAIAVGFSRMAAVRRHALRNALPPVLTHFGIRAAHLLAGAVIIEQIFTLPGLGQYAIQSVFNRDLGVLQAVVLLAAAATVFVNILTDVAQATLTPKVRLSA